MVSAAAVFVGCNSSDYQSYTSTYSSVAVTAFSLSDDDDILANLDSVYFSIDLERALIYNADSLPYGTDVSALVPVVKTLEGASVEEFHFTSVSGNDTIVNYLTNSTEAINFSSGDVRLRIVSLSADAERYYTVKVNVHTVESDSLVWGDMAYSALPTAFAEPKAQRTVQVGETLYCLSTDGADYCIAATDHPVDGQWVIRSVSFGFTPDVESFTGGDGVLYILDTDGNLYESADEADTWVSCGVQWSHIFGSLGGVVVGSALRDGVWYRVSYPVSAESVIPDDFPVSGMSQPVTYTSDMASGASLIFVGGRLASGALTNRTFGFDGKQWASLSNRAMPEALEDMTLLPYFTVRVNAAWVATEYSTLFAMGGRRADGSLNRTVYVSDNFGISWAEAGQSMQLPDDFPAMASSQAYVYDSTLESVASRDAKIWHTLASVRRSATKPLTEWECPYIYLFGGTDADGVLYNTVWRGVITRLTFEPLQ